MDDISMRLCIVIAVLALLGMSEFLYILRLKKEKDRSLDFSSNHGHGSNHGHRSEDDEEEEESNEYEEEIKNMVEKGLLEGVIEEDEQELINNVFEFGDKEVRDVMRFRKKIVGIDSSVSVEEGLRFMLEQPYSRYPLYSGDIDDIIGIIYLKDVTRAFYEKRDVTLDKLARPAVFVHETMDISDLYKKMQRKKTHMAVVVDEYGQTAGIVAMEDMTEVLMGNIYDEYDVVEKEVVKLGSEEAYLVQGITRLDVLEDLLGIEFPDEDVDTINGFILARLHHLPKDDDQIDISYEGYSFKAVDIHAKMIRQIKVSKIDQKEKGE
ncbi:MAG: hemolysin family protein [Lachnospiraceae bacterium]|nr:hemolysin family protein [Lachnospiraceae bacterium]